jgi:hypothetical protein
MYVDRATCDSCQDLLPFIDKYLGAPDVVIKDRKGNVYQLSFAGLLNAPIN